MSNKNSILLVEPREDELTSIPFDAATDSLEEYLGPEFTFVEIVKGFGFFCKVLDKYNKKDYNFGIALQRDVTNEIYGPVVFTRVAKDYTPIGLTDEEINCFLSNFLRMQNGKNILFVDNISDILYVSKRH